MNILTESLNIKLYIISPQKLHIIYYKVIKAKITWLFRLPQSHEIEAMGLKEAMKWFDSIGLSKMSIEVDCKQMIDGISKRFNTNFMVDAAIDICKTSL